MGMVLVTGGAGYIGSHTVVELLAKNFEVVVFDNLSNSRPEVLSSIRSIAGRDFVFEQVDLCDKQQLEAAYSKYKIDVIIHFAAFKSVNDSVQNPLKYYSNNLDSLLNLLNVAQKYKTDKIVFSSSCSVYGQPDELPVHENSKIKKAESPYAFTKQICEQILNDFGKSASMNSIALRYFNPVGAHSSAKIGEYPIGTPDNLVPVITQTAAGIRESLSVFGSDYDTSDGTAVRDYIHVVDVAIAHLKAVERLLDRNAKENFEIFNLGTGKGITVLEAIKSFEKSSGIKLNYALKARREGDVEKVYADTNKANSVLGWKANKSLDEMMSSAWAWECALKK